MQQQLKHQMSVQLIVQGLPFAYGWQDLKDIFKEVGGVVSADIVMGKDGRSRGWGVVNMESDDDAQRAIQVFHVTRDNCNEGRLATLACGLR